MRVIYMLMLVGLTLYAPVELTRLIWFQMHHEMFISYRVLQMPEIPYIWISYFGGLALIWKRKSVEKWIRRRLLRTKTGPTTEHSPER